MNKLKSITKLLKPKVKRLTPIQVLSQVPEEEIWLESRHSPQTRRAYKTDVQDFINTLGLNSVNEFRVVDHRAAIAWKRALEDKGLKPSTIRRKLSALSSLFAHLIKYNIVLSNPIRDVERPPGGAMSGTTAAFSPAEARKLLDSPPTDTTKGLRDRAMLAIGLQVGARRSEIVRLNVRDFHMNMGYWALHLIGKGSKDNVVSIHPQAAQRITTYLVAAGHGNDLDGPLFRPCTRGRNGPGMRRHLHPDTVDRVLRGYARRIGLKYGFSAHSMRATFITRTLENGASLEEVQRAVGHANPQTTKLYDRRGLDPGKSASFFASY